MLSRGLVLKLNYERRCRRKYLIGERINRRVKSGEAGIKIASRVLETAARYAGTSEHAQMARDLLICMIPKTLQNFLKLSMSKNCELIGDLLTRYPDAVCGTP